MLALIHRLKSSYLRHCQPISRHAGVANRDLELGLAELLHAAIGQSDVALVDVPVAGPRNRRVTCDCHDAALEANSINREIIVASEEHLRKDVCGINADEETQVCVTSERDGLTRTARHAEKIRRHHPAGVAI